MFKLIALFALVAVAAAEPEADPQWVYNYADVTPHLKTPSGDTVSVAAAKNHHLGLKAHEYAKKAHVYSPYVYNGVYSPYTYAHTAGVYNTYPMSYNYHHLYKREAESDAALVYRTNYQGYPFYNTGVYTYPSTYNTGVYSPYTYAHTTGVYNAGVYNAYPYSHHLYKREAEAEPEAESDAALVYRTNYQGYPFYNTGVYSSYPRMYNTGVYSAYPYTYNTAAYSAYPHNYMYNRLFKREAEPDSQYFYNNFNGYNGIFNRFNRFYSGYTPYTNFYNQGYYY